MLITGGFLSTMLPTIGLTVAQFPATLQTDRAPVGALDVSVLAGTLVFKEKLPSWGLARPEPASPAVQGMLTSLACQTPSGAAQLITGGVVSRTATMNSRVPVAPWLSVATRTTRLVPSGNVFVKTDPATSPKEPIHRSETGSPSGSRALPRNVTEAPFGPVASTIDGPLMLGTGAELECSW